MRVEYLRNSKGYDLLSERIISVPSTTDNEYILTETFDLKHEFRHNHHQRKNNESSTSSTLDFYPSPLSTLLHPPRHRLPTKKHFNSSSIHLHGILSQKNDTTINADASNVDSPEITVPLASPSLTAPLLATDTPIQNMEITESTKSSSLLHSSIQSTTPVMRDRIGQGTHDLPPSITTPVSNPAHISPSTVSTDTPHTFEQSSLDNIQSNRRWRGSQITDVDLLLPPLPHQFDPNASVDGNTDASIPYISHSYTLGMQQTSSNLYSSSNASSSTASTSSSSSSSTNPNISQSNPTLSTNYSSSSLTKKNSTPLRHSSRNLSSNTDDIIYNQGPLLQVYSTPQIPQSSRPSSKTTTPPRSSSSSLSSSPKYIKENDIQEDIVTDSSGIIPSQSRSVIESDNVSEYRYFFLEIIDMNVTREIL